jgi:hypothetical protein
MNLEQTKGIELAVIQALLPDDGSISVSKLEEHAKASEAYIYVRFYDSYEDSEWIGPIPYQYRRTATFLETEEDIATYLIELKPYFKRGAIDAWIQAELEHWNENMGNKAVTKPFFEALASLNWVRDLPQNRNPARRLQDIKELGYSIATSNFDRAYQYRLIPIPRGLKTGYETFSPKFKQRALKVLKWINVYDFSQANKAGLLPDHKFPEIRWDADTPAENPEDMLEDEIRDKFQLLDNQRNLQKREVCRKCFQTGKRGVLFGVNYFYEGDINWPTNVPKIGKSAEKGCIGCGWYDIGKWRDELNKLVSQTS